MKKKRLSLVLGTGGLVGLVMSAMVMGTSPAGIAASGEPDSTTICQVDQSDTSPTSGETRVVRTAAVADLLATSRSYTGPCADFGPADTLGNGWLRTYSQFHGNQPQAIGAVFSATALQGLPTSPMTDGHHCYDVNGDGSIDPMAECMGGYEHPLVEPARATSTKGSLTKWTLVNWNPMGHGPSGIYDVPHFDFHFYMMSKAERDAIRPGPCGMAMNCDDFATATKPIPAQFMPKDYVDLQAAEVAMGNHLVDTTSPEFTGTPFTHTFIYGAYDASIIFLEPMITYAWFQSLQSGAQHETCFPIKQPLAWQVSGWYPQTYCTAFRTNRNEFTVSMRDFTWHDAPATTQSPSKVKSSANHK